MEIRKDRSFFYLLFAMLFFLLASAVIDELSLSGQFQANNILFALTLLVAVFGMHGSRRLLYIGIALVATTAVGAGLANTAGGHIWIYVSFGSFLAYLLLALSMAVQQLIRNRNISLNQLVGTICVYLLLGVIWSLVYAALFAWDNEAFAGVAHDATFTDSQVWLYYSFVTLTTMGYGDIAPVSSLARTLAYLEAIVGQFYIAVLVAGLVSSFLAARNGANGEQQ